MIRLFATTALALLITACDGFPGISGSKTVASIAPGPTETPAPVNFFPLVEGATWTYKRYTYTRPEEVGQATYNGTETFAVLSLEVAGAQATASVRQTLYDKSGDELSVTSFKYFLTNDGVYHDQFLPNNRIMLFPLPLAAGIQELKPQATASTNTSWSTASAEVKTVAFDQTVLAANQKYVDCASIEEGSALTFKDKQYGNTYGSTSSTTVWLAPNIGIAKRKSLYSSIGLSTPYAITENRISELSTYSIPAYAK